MLDADFAELAAWGGEVVVATAAQGKWTRLGAGLADWCSRYGTTYRSEVLDNLTVLVTRLATAEPPRRDRIRARARAEWTGRLERAFVRLPPEERTIAAVALRALLASLAMPRPLTAASGDAVAVGGDVAVTAQGERSVAAVAIHGDVTAGPPAATPAAAVHGAPQEPRHVTEDGGPQEAPAVSVQHAGRDLRVENRGNGMAFGHAQVVHFHQASAPSAPVRLPYRIGRVPAPAAHFQERDVPGAGSAAPGGPPLVLTGTAGTGKTQLAARLAEQAWDLGQVHLLLWVEASSRASVLAAYTRAAQDLYGRGYPDPADGVVDFLNWCRPAGGTHEHPWLVVLDGVTDPADLDDLWPPVNPAGRVLVTSRRRDFGGTGSAAVVPVRGFTADEVRAYLERALDQRGLGSAEEDEVTRVVEGLGGRTAFLDDAVRRIVSGGLALDTYLDLVASGATFDPATPSPLWASIESANRASPAGLALPVLQLVAALGADGVLDAILWSGPALTLLVRLGASPAAPAGTAVTAAGVRAAVRTLRDMSLLEEQQDAGHRTVRIEEPVRSAVLAALSDDRHRVLGLGAADALAAAWPAVEPGRPLLDMLVRCTEALTVLGGSSLVTDDGIHPVAFQAGDRIGAWGRGADAESYFESLMVSGLAVLGPDHRDVLRARAHVARWRGERGDDLNAASELARVLALQEAAGVEAADILTTRRYLAWCRLNGTGWRTPEPRKELAAILGEQVRVCGPDHPETVATLRSLVLTMNHQSGKPLRGKVGDAVVARLFGTGSGDGTQRYTGLDCLVATIAELDRLLGPGHPDTAGMRRHLSVAHAGLGDTEAAKAVAEHALADALSSVGPDHAVTLKIRAQLALVWRRTNRPVRAVNELNAVLADRERLLGPDHPDTLYTRELLLTENLAPATGKSSDQHLTAVRRLVADLDRVCGRDHRRSRRVLDLLAERQARAGRPFAAIMSFGDLVVRDTHVLGPDHIQTLQHRARLACCRGEAGDVIGALVDLATLVSDQTRVLGPDHQVTLVTRQNAALFRGRAGDVEGAVADFTELLAEQERISGPGNPVAEGVRKSLDYWKKKL